MAKSNTPGYAKDRWETPEWLFYWLNKNYRFTIDLATSGSNSRLARYYTERQDAIRQKWSKDALKGGYAPVGFLNPPYSNITPWINKIIDEKGQGFTTVMVMPTPNGESYYRPLFNHASKITYINGRVAFIASCDFTRKMPNGRRAKTLKGTALSGNTRGTCVVEFTPDSRGLVVKNIDRDLLIKQFAER